MNLLNTTVRSYDLELVYLHCCYCKQEFEYENNLYQPLTISTCNHTVCRQCANSLTNATQCPIDNIPFSNTGTPLHQLPINFHLLKVFYSPSQLPNDIGIKFGTCSAYINLSQENQKWFNLTDKLFNDLSNVLRPVVKKEQFQNFSTSMVQHTFKLINNQFVDHIGRLNIIRCFHNLARQITIEFIQIYEHNNPTTSNNQFIEPRTFNQDIEVLNNILKPIYTQKQRTQLVNVLRELEQINCNSDDLQQTWRIIKCALLKIKSLLSSLIRARK